MDHHLRGALDRVVLAVVEDVDVHLGGLGFE
jgi:hypothetical protein